MNVLHAEINGVREQTKQGIPLTDGQLDIFLRKVVHQTRLRDKLRAMTAGE